MTSLVHADTSDTRYYDYMHGLLAEHAGHAAEALSDYQHVIEHDPQAREVYRDIAELQLRLGHTGEAVSAAEHIQSLSPKDPDTLMFLGNVYVAKGDLAKAGEVYENVLKVDPKNLRALENLGNYYSILDPAKGMTYYDRYLTINATDPEIYFQIGLVYQKQGKNAQAITAFKKSEVLDPDELPPHLALASMYETAFSTDAAIDEYQKSIEIEPQNAALYTRLGHLYYDSKKWDEAASAFQNARALAPEDGSISYWLARVDEEREDWKDAALQAETAFKQSKDPQMMPLIAYYLTLDHRPADAIPWLEKSRSANPKNTNALLFLGMNYLDVNQPEKARVVLSEGVALAPKDTQLLFQLGNAEDHLGHTDVAIQDFQTVLTMDPKDAGAMNYIGFTWAEAGTHLPEAEKLLRQAVTLDPTNGAYLDSLGWVRYKAGDRKEAIDWLEKAAHVLPDKDIYGHLGDVYLADGQPAQAWQAWTKELALDPTNKVLQKKIEDASQRVVPGSEQRKLLKYIEGNNRQIQTLSGAALVKARWHGHSFKTAAQIHYQKPDQLVLEVSPTSSTLRVVISSAGVHIEPAEYAQALGDVPLNDLEAIPAFLSGRLLAPLDNPGVKAESKKDTMVYSDATREAVVDLKQGVLQRYSEAQSSSDRYEVVIPSYTFVEGLWLPAEMQVSNPAQRWKATLNFSDWQINQRE